MVGDIIEVQGNGGYYYYLDGAYDESARSFDLYFGGKKAGSIVCYVNGCFGSFNVPIGTPPGLYEVKSKGGPPSDIKPQNILLKEDGFVAVSDFGIARALASSTRSRTAGVMGTPAYMSPEQWASGNLDGRLDQYALGIVLYEMLAGSAPFQGESMEALFVHHRESPMPALPGDPQVSAAVERVIRRATEKTQGARYASAGAMAAALEAAMAGKDASSTNARFPVSTAAPTRTCNDSARTNVATAWGNRGRWWSHRWDSSFVFVRENCRGDNRSGCRCDSCVRWGQQASGWHVCLTVGYRGFR